MAQTNVRTAITPTRQEDYPEWYQQVIKAADLAENSDVRGCMVIKPWGYAIWENIQKHLDRKFKETGHVNAYFPLFVPLSALQKEAEHVEGFAKECAVVTHHRLEAGPDGKLAPAGPLEEPLIVRPTSEMIIGAAYAKWVQSYRDLPILINQWANVVRWEMRTRLFLRTAEFLWQEGHTAHATAEEAMAETRLMHDIYADFAHNYLAIPVIKGRKTPDERFPGAVESFTIEAMMQDRKALQAGTSHFLGQNFAKAMDIKFQTEEGREAHVWTTSWGMTTRLIGALIMTHSDDDGLVLPPRVAPKHVVILPIYRNDEEKAKVLAYCEGLEKELRAQSFEDGPVEVFVDARDTRGGEKVWQHIKKGVPVRVEVGPRDIANDAVFVARRDKDHKDKTSYKREEFVKILPTILGDMQKTLLARARTFCDENTRRIDSADDFVQFFTPPANDAAGIHGGFALAPWVEDKVLQDKLKDLKVTTRCIPLEGGDDVGKCLFTGRAAQHRVIYAKSY